LHFLSISLGSLREVETHLVVARRIGYVAEPEFERTARACLNARKPLRGLINHLSKEDSNDL
jgi:four helix bundle protein